jgi:hypothetical protein
VASSCQAADAVVGSSDLRQIQPKTVLLMTPVYDRKVKSARRTEDFSAHVIPVK